jgi:hypothetical protein
VRAGASPTPRFRNPGLPVFVIVSPAPDGAQVRIRSRLPDGAGAAQEWVGLVEEALDLMADLGRGVSQESFWRTLRSA